MSDCCYECLRQKFRKLENERRCYALAKEIYKFIEEHPGSALEGKKITFKIPSNRVEAKLSGMEKKK